MSIQTTGKASASRRGKRLQQRLRTKMIRSCGIMLLGAKVHATQHFGSITIGDVNQFRGPESILICDQVYVKNLPAFQIKGRPAIFRTSLLEKINTNGSPPPDPISDWARKEGKKWIIEKPVTLYRHSYSGNTVTQLLHVKHHPSPTKTGFWYLEITRRHHKYRNRMKQVPYLIGEIKKGGCFNEVAWRNAGRCVIKSHCTGTGTKNHHESRDECYKHQQLMRLIYNRSPCSWIKRHLTQEECEAAGCTWKQGKPIYLRNSHHRRTRKTPRLLPVPESEQPTDSDVGFDDEDYHYLNAKTGTRLQIRWGWGGH